MQDDEKLELILERFYQRFNKYNAKVLQKIGESIKKIGKVSASEAHQLGQELKYGIELNQLLNELSKITGQSVLDIDKLLDGVAKENVNFAEKYYEAKNQEFVPYEENKELQRYVNTIKQETYGTFSNIVKTNAVGFTFKDKNNNTVFKPFKVAYSDLIDEAVYNVTSGVKDYQSAVRNTINAIADSGVRIHEEKIGYKGGYNRRIDSSVRQAVLEGVRKTNIGIQERIGEEIGANGLEVSVHFPCALDHLDIQGKQFFVPNGKTLDDALDKINLRLDRPIGTLNCRHFVFSVIKGIDEPQYSDNALFKLKQKNNETVEYEGKTYNMYEATQLQRKIESEIRKQKDRQIIARSSDDKIGIQKAQKKISQLTSKYNDFSKKADLPTYKNRMSVTGYRRVAKNKLK